MFARAFLVLAVSCGVCAVAAAADLPARRPGLWEITMKIDNSKIAPQVEKVCLDAATDQLLYKVGAGASGAMCSRLDVHSSGGTVVVDAECKLMSSTMSSHSTTTMSGDTAYHTQSTTHYEPALFGRTGSTSTHDAKWLGACPAGMRPGDVEVAATATMPVPMKMNLNDMFKGGK